MTTGGPAGRTTRTGLRFRRGLLNRANANMKKGDPDRAIADYTEAIRLNPKAAWVYHFRGKAYEKKGEKGKAEEDFAQAGKLGYKPK